MKEEMYKGRKIKISKLQNPSNYTIREPILAVWQDKEPIFQTHMLEGYGFMGMSDERLQRARGKTKSDVMKKVKKRIDILDVWRK